MKQAVVGILAHVDAGKTTPAEALLFTSGELRHRGRVDHRDTALDTHFPEKERGITIFAGEAAFTAGGDRRQFLIRKLYALLFGLYLFFYLFFGCFDNLI